MYFESNFGLEIPHTITHTVTVANGLPRAAQKVNAEFKKLILQNVCQNVCDGCDGFDTPVPVTSQQSPYRTNLKNEHRLRYRTNLRTSSCRNRRIGRALWRSLPHRFHVC